MLSIFVETMDIARDEVQEELLGDIIARGSDVFCSLFLNDTDGLEAAGYDYDGSGDLMPVQEGDREDGSGDPMPMHSLFSYVHILINSHLSSFL